MNNPLTDAEILELRHALPTGGWADKLANRLADEVMRLRDAADNVNCERDMAEAAFKDAHAEAERLRAVNEGLFADLLESRKKEGTAKLAKAVAALERICYHGNEDFCAGVARQTLKEIGE